MLKKDPGLETTDFKSVVSLLPLRQDVTYHCGKVEEVRNDQHVEANIHVFDCRGGFYFRDHGSRVVPRGDELDDQG